jgi:gp32 DNA binding protein like
MTKKSLSDLVAAFATKTSTGSDQTWKLFFSFWKAPVGTVSSVRFLPDQDESNPLAFLVENMAHELVVNGKREKVACLKMYGEDCPICALSQKYYDEKDPEHNEALGKKYYRKKSYIGQVLVIDSPVEHDAAQLVKLIEFGPAIFKAMQTGFNSGDLENPPYELKGGHNFRIKKDQSGQYADYKTSSFSPKQTDVADDVIEQLELYDLKAYRTPKTDRAQVEAMLIADQTGASTPMQTEEAPVKAAAPVKSAAVTKQQDEEVAAPAAVTAQAAPASGAKLSVVEQLRARQAAKAAAAAAAE